MTRTVSPRTVRIVTTILIHADMVLGGLSVCLAAAFPLLALLGSGASGQAADVAITAAFLGGAQLSFVAAALVAHWLLFHGDDGLALAVAAAPLVPLVIWVTYVAAVGEG